MSGDSRARAAFLAYRALGTAATPLLRAYVAWRATRGKEEGVRRRERTGHPSAARPPGEPLVWVHAASVGESAAVLPLVRAIAGQGMRILMTTGTVTSAAFVRERLGNAVIHQYVPLDLRAAASRFLDHWRPKVAIVAESEIWPVTLTELRRRRIPQILVNARLSDRSFRRWQSVPAIARMLLEQLAHVIAQSDLDAERFAALGAGAVTVAGNLKAEADPPPCDPAALDALRARIGERSTWGAVSTHPGEESVAAAVHLALKAERPRLLTLIVPRHVDRADAIERELVASGLTVARRGRGEDPAPDTDILLGDTMGEMGLYLRLTEIVFVGKSLAGTGGQNPLEAAMLGTAVLSGCNMQNFRDVYAKLLTSGGARVVEDGEELAAQVGGLLTDSDARRTMMAAGQASAAAMRGALVRTMVALDPFLRPLEPARDRQTAGETS